MPIFPLLPDWSNGVSETLLYRTAIVESEDMTEQRSAMMDSPRRSLGYSLRTDLRPKLDAFLHSRNAATFDAPDVVAMPTYLRAPAEEGDTSIHLDVLPAWSETADQIALISRDHCEVVSIDTSEVAGPFSGGLDLGYRETRAMALSEPLTRSWGAGTLVYPTIPARLQATQRVSLLTSSVGSADLVVEQRPGYPVLPASSESNVVFDGLDVLDLSPNWINQPVVDHELPRRAVDYQRNATALYMRASLRPKTIQFAYLGQRHEIDTVRDFFLRAKGRRGAFWVPSWTDDLEPAVGIVDGGSTLTVRGREAVESYADSPSHKAICIRKTDGTNVYRRVVSIGEAGPPPPPNFSAGFDIGSLTSGVTGEQSLIALEEPLVDGIAVGQMLQVCWLYQVRFATDNLVINWLHHDAAEVLVNVRTLPVPATEET